MLNLISSFSIVSDEHGSTRMKGRLVPCEPVAEPGFQDRLTQHKNYRGFSYEENHLEEWIARQPAALFGIRPVLLLVSQNYVHLRVKIDLLFVDADCRFYPVELKVVRVGKNGGVVPYDLYERQMKPYVNFLAGIRSLSDLDSNYIRFNGLFNGLTSHPAEDFAGKFGKLLPETASPVIHEVYVAQDFDSYAVEYFTRRANEDERTVQLVSYKFFPKTNYIEFWSVYQSPEKSI